MEHGAGAVAGSDARVGVALSFGSSLRALHRILASPSASAWIRDLSAGSMWWTCFAWGPYDSRGRTAKQGPKSVALSAQERYDCRSPTQNRSTPSSSWHQ
ncbi:hypothetical protein JOD54_003643 [Actinokineospora baliensis]|nr:hypothetical protein [Actinokineospora baliensis]